MTIHPPSNNRYDRWARIILAVYALTVAGLALAFLAGALWAR